MCYKKSGKLELIKEYNQLCDRLESLRTEIDKEKKNAKKLLPKPQYNYIVQVRVLNPSEWNNLITDTESIVIVRKLCMETSKAYESYCELYGESVINPPKDEISLEYYRTKDNILTASSGGYHMLVIPKLCSDQQWENLKKGNLTEFLK